MYSLHVELQMPGEVDLGGENLLVDAEGVVVEKRGETVGKINTCLGREKLPLPHSVGAVGSASQSQDETGFDASFLRSLGTCRGHGARGSSNRRGITLEDEEEPRRQGASWAAGPVTVIAIVRPEECQPAPPTLRGRLCTHLARTQRRREQGPVLGPPTGKPGPKKCSLFCPRPHRTPILREQAVSAWFMALDVMSNFLPIEINKLT